MYSDARYRLRPLMRSDVESCAAIEAVSYPAAVCEGVEVFKRILLVAPSCCWVVVDDSDDSKPYDTAVIGYSLSLPLIFEEDCPLELSEKSIPCRFKANTLYVHDLAVAPEHRRRGVATILQEAVASLARFSELRTITLTAVCGADNFWRRHGFSTLVSRDAPNGAQLSEAARSRLNAYPVEAGDVVLMQYDLLRPKPAEAVAEEEDVTVIPTDDAISTAAAAAPAICEPATPHSSRNVGLPPKMSSAPRTRLGMRLAVPLRPELISSQPFPPYRLVEYGRKEKVSSGSVPAASLGATTIRLRAHICDTWHVDEVRPLISLSPSPSLSRFVFHIGRKH